MFLGPLVYLFSECSFIFYYVRTKIESHEVLKFFPLPVFLTSGNDYLCLILARFY